MEPRRSDWKMFRESLDEWRERYLKWKNEEIKLLLENKNRNDTEKFWDIFNFQKEESRKLKDCLDGLSRSKMTLQMALMMKYKMIDREDLKRFSEGLQNFLHEFLEKN
jgi:hypothetical protein